MTTDRLVQRPAWKEYALFEEQEDEQWAAVGRWFGCTNQGMTMRSPYRYHVAAGSTREQMQFVCLVCCRMATDGHLLSRMHMTNYLDDEWFRFGIEKNLGKEMVESRMASAKLWEASSSTSSCSTCSWNRMRGPVGLVLDQEGPVRVGLRWLGGFRSTASWTRTLCSSPPSWRWWRRTCVGAVRRLPLRAFSEEGGRLGGFSSRE